VPIELDERDIGKLRRGAQLAGAQRGRRASDAAKVAFDRIETFGQRDGSHEARALDAEAGLGSNSARILELVADKAVSTGWERLNDRHGAVSPGRGIGLALRSVLLLSSGAGREDGIYTLYRTRFEEVPRRREEPRSARPRRHPRPRNPVRTARQLLAGVRLRTFGCGRSFVSPGRLSSGRQPVAAKEPQNDFNVTRSTPLRAQ